MGLIRCRMHIIYVTLICHVILLIVMCISYCTDMILMYFTISLLRIFVYDIYDA